MIQRRRSKIELEGYSIHFPYVFPRDLAKSKLDWAKSIIWWHLHDGRVETMPKESTKGGRSPWNWGGKGGKK